MSSCHHSHIVIVHTKRIVSEGSSPRWFTSLYLYYYAVIIIVANSWSEIWLPAGAPLKPQKKWKQG